MISMGIRNVAEPQEGRIEMLYTEEEQNRASRFINEYIDTSAEEYDGDLDDDIPDEVLAAAIVFAKASRILHFTAETGARWLIDSSPNIYEEGIRAFAEQHLGMERVEETTRRVPSSFATIRRAIRGMRPEEISQIEDAIADRSRMAAEAA